MSAPNTNIKKQEREHKVPLSGIAWSIIFAAVLLIGLIVYLTAGGNEPGDDTPIGAEQRAAQQSTTDGAASGDTGGAASGAGDTAN